MDEVVGGLRAAGAVAEPAQRACCGLRVGELVTQALGRVLEPAVVRRGQVQHRCLLFQHQLDLPVGDHLRRARLVILQLLLDGPEEGQQCISAGAGGKLALLELVERLKGPGAFLRGFRGLPLLMEDRLGASGPG
ncbi:hypothetical protein [Streptomyces inhibens]|uniref:hypothetical protein n=1 Tax=Streptomyces inhibens TaxID=2293571 RepID=UPI001EE6C58A|nr:hypothetical protein [Streptomyces inhibens]UKY50317.1 hypothetical protein KI385_16820 [Streptomyces inhibens]